MSTNASGDIAARPDASLRATPEDVTTQFKEAQQLFADGNGSPENIRRAEHIFLALANDNDHAPSAYELGRLYVFGASGILKDLKMALRYYEAAAEAGLSAAYFPVATIHQDGNADAGIPRDLPRAVHFYHQAIAADNTEALNNLALLLRHGDAKDGVQKDAREAESLYRRAIAAGDTNALNNLAVLLRSGDAEDGVQKNAREAESLYRRAIATGKTNALFNLAVLLQIGDVEDGVQKDAREAESLYRRAIAAGGTYALNNMALLLQIGDAKDGVQKDAREAESLYRRAIAAGDTDALNNLAVFLRHGDAEDGVQKDAREAESLYRRAIAAGNTDALNNLAVLLRHGDAEDGVQKDALEAESLYRRAIAAGNTDALQNLGLLLEIGDAEDGVQKDAREAESLFRRAIAAGHTNAPINLALLLRNGDAKDGVTANLQEFMRLIVQTIEAGNVRAHAYLGLTYQAGAPGLRINLDAACGSFRRGWVGGDNFSGYLLARLLLEHRVVEDDCAEAVCVLDNIRCRQGDCAAIATHELAVIFERGLGSGPSDISRSAHLHLATRFNSSTSVVHHGYTPTAVVRSGPAYPKVIEHVLKVRKAVPKKCLLLTLGGGARGKTETVNSIKRMDFAGTHETTMMADFTEYVASLGDEQLDEGFIEDIDFNDSSVQAAVKRESDDIDIPALERIIQDKPRTYERTVKMVQSNSELPHVDVIERVRRAMLVSEYGHGFRQAAVAVWDMAGQHEYEMSHSLFVHRANILVFVVNLARVQDEKTMWSEVQLLAYWIKFAYMLISHPENVRAVIVGTHRDDCVSRDDVMLTLCAELHDVLGCNIRETWFHDFQLEQVPENIVAVENKISKADRAGSGLERLEDVIQKAADEIVDSRAPMMVRWLALIDKLNRLEENFYNRRGLLRLCEQFPGFPENSDEKEKDILAGLAALASMGKLVLFEVCRDEWYVFLDVHRIVKAVGAVVSAVRDKKGRIPRRAMENLTKGIVEEGILSTIWSNLGEAERVGMRKLLISYDILMDLSRSGEGTNVYGAPALFQCGALDKHWGHDDGEKDLYVQTKFVDAIPAGIIGRLMAYLHRTLSPSAPHPQLIRQNVSLINILGSGQAIVTFNRRAHELRWIFRGKHPACIARTCLRNLEDLFTSSGRHLSVTRSHKAIADCGACPALNSVNLPLGEEWIHDAAAPASADTPLPHGDLFCSLCSKERSNSVIVWFRDPGRASDVSSSSDRGVTFGSDALEKYDVFVSHAGEDKLCLAEPLHRALEWWGIKCFLDFKSLECSVMDAPFQMNKAMGEAKIGIFILSPEFAVRRWPMKELRAFLERKKSEGVDNPTIIPVFYRLTTEECRHFFNFRQWYIGNHVCLLRQSENVRRHIEAEGSTAKLAEDLSSICVFTGEISHRPGERPDGRLPDAVIMQNIVDSVLNAARKHSFI